MCQENVLVIYLFLIVALLYHPSVAFLFSLGGDEAQCYRADVQRCLEKAFHAMRIETKRDADYARPSSPHSAMSASSSSRKRRNAQRDQPRAVMSRSRHLCAANRPYLSCFSIPGCRDEYVAHIASVVFHGIHGRVHPIQMFLAHRGYALQLCSQTCSRESHQHCQRMMNAKEQNEDHGIYLELVGISKQLTTSSGTTKDWSICNRFKNSLATLVRYRSGRCGEAAKCVCMDPNIHAGIVYCNAGCEHLLDQITNAPIASRNNYASSSASATTYFVSICLPFIVFMLRFSLLFIF